MKPLTGDIARIADGGDWTSRYASKFAARRAVVLACVARGWDENSARAKLIMDDSPALYLWESDRGNADTPDQRFTRDWRAAVQRFRESPSWQSAAEVRQWLGQLTSEIESARWTGRTGRTDQAVMLAVLAIASRAGTSEPDLPVRTVAMEAGVSLATACRSLARLRDAGWIRRTWKSGSPYDTAQRYKVSLNGTDSYEVPTELSVPLRDTSHETWVRLGMAALATWSALDVQPRGVREVARRAGVGKTTASRWLPKLASYDLAARGEYGWIAGKATADDVARNEGWQDFNSKVFRRELSYIEDRAIYAERKTSRGKTDAIRRADAIAAKHAA